jgi:hypothetical protein
VKRDRSQLAEIFRLYGKREQQQQRNPHHIYLKSGVADEKRLLFDWGHNQATRQVRWIGGGAVVAFFADEARVARRLAGINSQCRMDSSQWLDDRGPADRTQVF